MSFSGEVYAEVEASVVNNGINPMAIVSGNPEPIDGQAYVVVWIRWRYDNTTGEGGYTGTGWYWNDPNNGLHDSSYWEDNEASFKQWLVDNKPTDFDQFLSTWNPDQKAAFLNSHLGVLEAGDCVYFTANSNPSGS